jgi:hypothetical protein
VPPGVLALERAQVQEPVLLVRSKPGWRPKKTSSRAWGSAVILDQDR